MICVLAASPAIDVTYRVEDATWGDSHRVDPPLKRAGGKGVNVARVLSQLGSTCLVVMPLGGHAGTWIAGQLRHADISVSEVSVSGDTRTCVAVVSGPDGHEVATLFNEKPAPLQPADWHSLVASVLDTTRNASVFVVSGTIPDGISASDLGSLVSTVSAQCPVIADTQGDYLREAARAGALLVCPNSAEAREATGTVDDQTAALTLHELGAQHVLITQGKDGGVLLSGGVFHSFGVPVLSGNPTGAGDALAAGIAHALEKSLPLTEAIPFGFAVSLSSLGTPWAGEIDTDSVKEFLPRISSSTSGGEGLYPSPTRG
jgi:tagatose 6-phosphate kinase